MSIENRAAQFAPFASLSGHEETLREVIRQTEDKRELSDDERNILSSKIDFLLQNHAEAIITFYVPDETKSGGTYKKISGIIKKIDESDDTLILKTGEKINLSLISDIEIPEFEF